MPNHAIAEMAKLLLADLEDQANSADMWDPTSDELESVAEQIKIEHGRYPTVFEYQIAGYGVPIDCPFCDMGIVVPEEKGNRDDEPTVD